MFFFSWRTGDNCVRNIIEFSWELGSVMVTSIRVFLFRFNSSAYPPWFQILSFYKYHHSTLLGIYMWFRYKPTARKGFSHKNINVYFTNKKQTCRYRYKNFKRRFLGFYFSKSPSWRDEWRRGERQSVLSPLTYPQADGYILLHRYCLIHCHKQAANPQLSFSLVIRRNYDFCVIPIPIHKK